METPGKRRRSGRAPVAEKDTMSESEDEIEEESPTGSFLNAIYSFIYPGVKEVNTSHEYTHNNFEAAVTGSRHHFLANSFGIPTYCNFCKEIIWGFGGGHSCALCGYTIHTRCMKKAPLSCRPKLALSPDSHVTDETEMPGELISNLFKHHFVEGNIPLGSECCICSRSFELFSFTGFRCSRCENAVHEDCKRKMAETLCKPRHKNLLYIPNAVVEKLNHELLLDNLTPLIVFINTRSGGQYGNELLLGLSRLLDKHQVFDLNADHGPERGLMKFSGVPNLRILVCGGDGTVGWVMNSIDRLKLDPFPPVAILPLGTGNDLARTLGWGTGFTGEDLSPLLDQIERATEVSLDRWTVSLSNSSTQAVETKLMNNYMSVGVDAEVALQFHTLRTAQPELFTSQFINKFWYTHYGMRCMFSDIDELARMLDLEVDGVPVRIPSGIGGLMILNLPNYAGGVNLWGTNVDEEDSDGEEEMERTPKFQPQSIDDKLIEVVAITGSFHMGTITVNLSQALRIAQGSSIKITLRQQLPVQVDGEPWLQDPSEISIQFEGVARMLYKRDEDSLDDSDALHQIRAENVALKAALKKANEELVVERELRLKLEEELRITRKNES
eukprot:TRINITY_DN5311_c0_g1_i1.p1 TRINITY_DN5311_c0_g1~~TRINITY_DN5311_c0_g1_i1.p1  ORF type:complete len:613 (+),score=123.37 TRINITY_DN5311_c0_g1_i1:378-2216(+)